MSCIRPWIYRKPGTDEQYAIPCGYCLNCKVDRRNSWRDRAEYQLRESGCGCFITLTYNDMGIKLNRVVSKHDGQTRFTLNYSDVKHFLMRLKSRAIYETKTRGHNPQFSDKFKYIVVGEYGEKPLSPNVQLGRSHYHVLIFGVSPAYKNTIAKCWRNGFVKVLPILRGGINYVLKYMDKQQLPVDRFETYKKHGVRPPFQVQSNGLGSNLYKLTRPETIMNHGWCYKVGPNKYRPFPAYWRNKYLDGMDNPLPFMDSWHRTISDMRRYNLKDFSAKAVVAFQKNRSLLREQIMVAQAHNAGKAVVDYYSQLLAPRYKPFLHRFSDTQLKYLSQEYIDRLNEKFLETS